MGQGGGEGVGGWGSQPWEGVGGVGGVGGHNDVVHSRRMVSCGASQHTITAMCTASSDPSDPDHVGTTAAAEISSPMQSNEAG